MAYRIRVDVTDGASGVLSCHEFYGDTAKEAQDNLEEFDGDCAAFEQADLEDRLIIGDVEEIEDDEVPEVEADDDEGEEDGAEVIDAEIVEKD